MNGDPYTIPDTPNWVCTSVGGCDPAPIITTGVLAVMFLIALSVLVVFGLFVVLAPAFADEQRHWDELDDLSRQHGIVPLPADQPMQVQSSSTRCSGPADCECWHARFDHPAFGQNCDRR